MKGSEKTRFRIYHTEIFCSNWFHAFFDSFGKYLTHKNPGTKNKILQNRFYKIRAAKFFFSFFSPFLLVKKKSSFLSLEQLLFKAVSHFLIFNPAWAIYWSMIASFKPLFFLWFLWLSGIIKWPKLDPKSRHGKLFWIIIAPGTKNNLFQLVKMKKKG